MGPEVRFGSTEMGLEHPDVKSPKMGLGPSEIGLSAE